VTAADALRQSLNRPAVRLLARVGPTRFAASLRAAGVTLHLPRGGTPSAALALGGAGVRLLDLAALYADLADGGVIARPHVLAAPSPPTGALVSRHAADMVAAILRGQPAPPGVVADPGHPIAYKTGTSYGFRDAWACGFTPEYTVVVWVGRRDGSPRPGATGRGVAAPLLFRIFGLLPAEPPVANNPGADNPGAENPGVPAARLAPALERMTRHAKLRIVFPPGNVDLALDPAVPIDLRAIGGTPPYAWTVDGLPLPNHGSALWSAQGPGFAHLTVTDRSGQSASADVRMVAE
jgi:penicillin-binding protein 1C